MLDLVATWRSGIGTINVYVNVNLAGAAQRAGAK